MEDPYVSSMRDAVNEVRERLNAPPSPDAWNIRLKDGMLEIFGGNTGYREESPYDVRWESLHGGPFLADFLRQVSSKSWARENPNSFIALIHIIAAEMDSESRSRHRRESDE